MRRTDLIIVGCISFLIGVYAGRFSDVSFLPVLVGVLCLLAIRKRRLRYSLAVCLITFGLGNMRGVLQNRGFERLRQKFETKTTLVATSVDDAEYDSRGQLAFSANHIAIDGTEVPGQVALSGFGEFSVLRGDTVEVTGKLLSARGANQARMSFARIDTVGKDISWYNKLRRQFIKKLRDNLPEPLSSFAGGLIIGQRATIPDSIITDLRTAGLAHIIAVSGYNLTIIIRGVMLLLKRFSRYQKLITSLSVIVVFLLITGFSASIVRAGIVSGMSLLAWYYGRTFRPAVLLLLSAVLTVLFKPEYIWGDVGWYLSFLAFTGIMLLSPILRERLYPGKVLKLVRATLIDTLAVLALVIPYSMYIFGTVSLIALPANMLVAPTIPVAMALTAFSSILPHQLALLAVPTILVLDGILQVTHLLASVPLSSVNIKISTQDMLILYIVVATIAYAMWRKSKKRIESSLLIQ